MTLNKSATTMAVGGSELLTAIIQPSNATNQNVSWSSSNNAAASVSNSGLVTANAAGTARITATTQDGGRTAYCDVTVSAANVPVTGVSLSQTTMSLTAGNTGQLTAQVQPSNATNKNVSWSSNNNAAASVSNSGLVTAHAAGTARITVTTQDGGRTAFCDVTVSAANVPVTGVSLNKSATTLTLGSTEQLTHSIQPANATNKAVTWETSNSAVATVSSGLITAIAPGSATITVRTVDGNHTATCAVMVYPISVTGVSLNKNAMTLGVGATEQLVHTIQPSNATNQGVTWETSNSGVATVSSGLVTAIASGSATITVRTNDGNHTATCAVTVITPVTGVSLNKTETTLTIGGAEQLTHTIQPANATNQAVAWETSNSAIATVNNGLVTAIATGNAAITVRTNDGGHTATCFVTVNPTPVTGITLNKNTMTLIESGGSEQLTHTILPANATNQNVTWASSNTNIAIVSNGLVVAIAKGQARITARTADGGHTATCNVTVANVYVAGSYLWKDYVAQELSSTSYSSYANSVFVSGGNVYVAGYVAVTYSATLWVNGVPQYLTDGTTTAGEANSVFVSGSDVYVAGYVTAGSYPRATLWVNGVAQYLSDGTANAQAQSVFVSGSDVYVAGYVTAGSYTRATLWVNGSPQYLTDGTANARANSVFVSGSDVYVAGYSGSSATLWVNRIPQYLNIEMSSTNANSVFVSGNDVYVAGYRISQGGMYYNATLWVNGVNQYLGTAYAYSVFVSGSDVYVAVVFGLSVNGVVRDLSGGYTYSVFLDNGGAVSSIWLEPALTLETGQTKTLAPAILPINALNKSVVWSSDKPGLVSVNSAGQITALAPGAATITATTSDGGYTATCVVTVM
ncbi:MAG: Ig-like domain-containing protein [Holophagales bacterium]|nr:Ig-like domain-containing protein [Holophagales bacterium]